MFNFKHSDASQTFLMLHDNTTLRCNEHLMMALGKCLYYNGDYFQAEDIFSSTLCANPDNVEAIGLMAVLCGQEGGCEQDSADMDYLFAKVSSEVKYTASHWFAHAQLLYDEGKFERGLNFVEKCLDSEPRNHEALILRGRLLIALERHTQAVCAFRTAQMVAPYRFEIYRGLFHSYLAQKRFKEANALCNWTIRLFQNSPRSFTVRAIQCFHLHGFIHMYVASLLSTDVWSHALSFPGSKDEKDCAEVCRKVTENQSYLHAGGESNCRYLSSRRSDQGHHKTARETRYYLSKGESAQPSRRYNAKAKGTRQGDGILLQGIAVSWVVGSGRGSSL